MSAGGTRLGVVATAGGCRRLCPARAASDVPAIVPYLVLLAVVLVLVGPSISGGGPRFVLPVAS